MQIIIKASQFKSMPWKNGQGATLELMIEPDGARFFEGDFDWRFSIATIEQDSDFSPLASYDRAFAVLEGEGVDLQFADGEIISLPQRGKTVHFAGERSLRAHLHAGPTRDLNVMTKRGKFTGELWLRPLVDSMVLFVEPNQTWLVYVHQGQAGFELNAASHALAQGDMLRLDADASCERLVLRGGGEVVIAKISKV